MHAQSSALLDSHPHSLTHVERIRAASGSLLRASPEPEKKFSIQVSALAILVNVLWNVSAGSTFQNACA